MDVFRRLLPAWPQLRLVLVPRHPERFEAVGRLLDAAGVAWQRRTDLDRGGPEPGRPGPFGRCRGRIGRLVGNGAESPLSAAAWATAAGKT